MFKKYRRKDEFDWKRMIGNPNCVFDDFLCALKITYLKPPESWADYDYSY